MTLRSEGKKSIDLFSMELDEASTQDTLSGKKCVFCLLSKSQYLSKDYWLGVNSFLVLVSRRRRYLRHPRLLNPAAKHSLPTQIAHKNTWKIIIPLNRKLNKFLPVSQSFMISLNGAYFALCESNKCGSCWRESLFTSRHTQPERCR